MTFLTGVLDASVAIGLTKGGVFGLLSSLYSPLYIPTAVSREIVIQGQGRAGAAELAQALGGWITEVTPDPGQLQLFSSSLSDADRTVLAVAVGATPPVDHILADDKVLLREARRHGLTCLRTPDVVILMKGHGLLPEVKPVLDQMIQNGHGIDTALYEKALKDAGELASP